MKDRYGYWKVKLIDGAEIDDKRINFLEYHKANNVIHLCERTLTIKKPLTKITGYLWWKKKVTSPPSTSLNVEEFYVINENSLVLATWIEKKAKDEKTSK